MTRAECSGEAYMVVRNHEEQYPIWPADRPVPAGWTAVGAAAPRQACLKRIGGPCTDMRPAMLRRSMDATPR